MRLGSGVAVVVVQVSTCGCNSIPSLESPYAESVALKSKKKKKKNAGDGGLGPQIGKKATRKANVSERSVCWARQRQWDRAWPLISGPCSLPHPTHTLFKYLSEYGMSENTPSTEDILVSQREGQNFF